MSVGLIVCVRLPLASNLASTFSNRTSPAMNNNEENNGTDYSKGPPKKKGKKQESEDSSDDEPLGAYARGSSGKRAERAKLKKDSGSDSEDEESSDDDDDEDEDWMDEISDEMENPNDPDALLVQELMMEGDGGEYKE